MSLSAGDLPDAQGPCRGCPADPRLVDMDCLWSKTLAAVYYPRFWEWFGECYTGSTVYTHVHIQARVRVKDRYV